MDENPYKAEHLENRPRRTRRLLKLLGGFILGGFLDALVTPGTGEYWTNAVPILGAVLGVLIAELISR